MGMRRKFKVFAFSVVIRIIKIHSREYGRKREKQKYLNLAWLPNPPPKRGNISLMAAKDSSGKMYCNAGNIMHKRFPCGWMLRVRLQLAVTMSVQKSLWFSDDLIGLDFWNENDRTRTGILKVLDSSNQTDGQKNYTNMTGRCLCPCSFLENKKKSVWIWYPKNHTFWYFSFWLLPQLNVFQAMLTSFIFL